MAGKLTPRQQNKLRKNKYIKSVTDYRIYYTDTFKEYFIHEYINGRGPSDIFRGAGIDPSLLGSKRIERAAARWREEYDIQDIGTPMLELRKKESRQKKEDLAKEYRSALEDMTKELEEKNTELYDLRILRNAYLEQISKLQEENMKLKKDINSAVG